MLLVTFLSECIHIYIPMYRYIAYTHACMSSIMLKSKHEKPSLHRELVAKRAHHTGTSRGYIPQMFVEPCEDGAHMELISVAIGH